MSGNKTTNSLMICQVLKQFQVVCFNDISIALKYLVLAPDTASVNAFCRILVPVPVPVPETASVNTPLCVNNYHLQIQVDYQDGIILDQ